MDSIDATSYFSIVDSAIGPLTLRWTNDALTGLFFANAMKLDGQRAWIESNAKLAPAKKQLDEYLNGKRTTFDLPLAFLSGTPFQQRVWRALREIPFGATTSYGAIARSIGKPEAIRAVGAANGRNPIAIIVPCHRVIGADGSLTGFGGGLPRKKWLLSLERQARYGHSLPSAGVGWQ